MRDIRSDVLFAIKKGAFYATLLSVYALTLVVLSRGRVLDKYGPNVTVIRVIVVYYSAAVLGGTVVGVLKPIAKTLLGSMLIGFLVALIGGFFVLMTLLPPEEWRSVLPLATVLFALALGPGAGAINWYFDRKDRRSAEM